MNKTLSVVVALLIAVAQSSFAHDRKAVCINEVMVGNETSVIDDYGQHTAWIELFNANFAPINISSMYITNDPQNPKKYPVPRGSEITQIGKRQHILFYADNLPNRGPQHTNFTLVPGQDNWIGLYDADGETLIDSITIPAAVLADQSYARAEDGDKKWQIRTGNDSAEFDYITPGSANIIKESNERIDAFAENDSAGTSMTIIAMCIVFSALIVLSLCFYITGLIGKHSHSIKKARATGMDIDQAIIAGQDSGEEIAAIVLALHEHFNRHDNESLILTVKKMKRAYSPWSSKIYNMRQLPKRK